MLPIIIMTTAFAVFSTLSIAEHKLRETPPEMVRAKLNADLLRSFGWLVTAYMSSHPSHTGALSWATIAAAASTPPGMANSLRYANFSAVGTPASYRICTNYGKAELAYIISMIPLWQVPTASSEEACTAP